LKKKVNLPFNVDHDEIVIVEIRMKQSWVKDNKFLSIRFEVADLEFVAIETLFKANQVVPKAINIRTCGMVL
jgi:hypothetical protein